MARQKKISNDTDTINEAAPKRRGRPRKTAATSPSASASTSTVTKRKSTVRELPMQQDLFDRSQEDKVSSRRVKEIIGVIFVAFGAISLLGIFGFSIGALDSLTKIMQFGFGWGSAIPSAYMMVQGYFFIVKHHGMGVNKSTVGWTLLLMSMLILWHAWSVEPGRELLPESLMKGGGVVAGLGLFLLHKLVGVNGALVVIIAMVICSILLATKLSLGRGIENTQRRAGQGAIKAKTAAGRGAAKAKTAATAAAGVISEKSGQVIDNVHGRVDAYREERARRAAEREKLAAQQAELDRMAALQNRRTAELPPRDIFAADLAARYAHSEAALMAKRPAFDLDKRNEYDDVMGNPRSNQPAGDRHSASGAAAAGAAANYVASNVGTASYSTGHNNIATDASAAYSNNDATAAPQREITDIPSFMVKGANASKAGNPNAWGAGNARAAANARIYDRAVDGSVVAPQYENISENVHQEPEMAAAPEKPEDKTEAGKVKTNYKYHFSDGMDIQDNVFALKSRPRPVDNNDFVPLQVAGVGSAAGEYSQPAENLPPGVDVDMETGEVIQPAEAQEKTDSKRYRRQGAFSSSLPTRNGRSLGRKYAPHSAALDALSKNIPGAYAGAVSPSGDADGNERALSLAEIAAGRAASMAGSSAKIIGNEIAATAASSACNIATAATAGSNAGHIATGAGSSAGAMAAAAGSVSNIAAAIGSANTIAASAAGVAGAHHMAATAAGIAGVQSMSATAAARASAQYKASAAAARASAQQKASAAAARTGAQRKASAGPKHISTPNGPEGPNNIKALRNDSASEKVDKRIDALNSLFGGIAARHSLDDDSSEDEGLYQYDSTPAANRAGDRIAAAAAPNVSNAPAAEALINASNASNASKASKASEASKEASSYDQSPVADEATNGENGENSNNNNAELNFTVEYSSDNEGTAAELGSVKDEEPSVEEQVSAATSLTRSVNSLFSAMSSEPKPKQTSVLPPYEMPNVKYLLSKSSRQFDDKLQAEIAENAKVLQQTLNDFKVRAEIKNACHGPAVTRYEVKPAPGVKVSKITSLSDDIALNMAATAVRIEQIPGRPAIGIEIPNKTLESVQLREVLEHPNFAAAKSKLTVGLGKDISGQAIFADLAKMPHLLVAGATGSGKSVCINTMIASILFKARPEEVKFILIDPKMVELSVYNDIPHLMVPVVTDARKAAAVLNWAVQEMEKRYGKIAEVGVRNAEGYNRFYSDDPAKQMSSIVIIIDELADLMMVASHEVEDSICRLAQKARAAGIYMVLATQRPSVNVITGVIKANIPSRISFAVTSQIDSRTILDTAGAEKLLGRGDMLFMPQGTNKPTRIQGAFVSDHEVEELVEYIKKQGHKTEANQEIIEFTNKLLAEGDEESSQATTKLTKVDPLLREAVEMVMSSQNASVSSIQRRYRIGYTRAGRLIDTMEELGIVGPNIGSKPREILVTPEQAFEIMDGVEL